MTSVSRRHALAATVGLGVPLLAACGEDDPAGGGSTASESPSDSPTSAAASPTKKTKGGSQSTAGIATTSEVPVGGGVVLSDEEVVITQPTEGDFKAFSAICTHQGCLLARVTDEIECDCHGSHFSISDGSPTAGPATSPLTAVDITVSGKSIELA